MLYGHPGSRSPLINWAALELNVKLAMGDLVDNPHPFGKLPCMTDQQGEIGIFESGAILQYLQDNYYDDRYNQPLSLAQSAALASWIFWANASLEPICLLSAADGSIKGTGLQESRAGIRDQFSSIFLVGDKFTLADVSVASYLLYIPQHFPGTDLMHWPHLVSYMKDCARRQGFSAAFGTGTQALVMDELDYSFASGGGGGGVGVGVGVGGGRDNRGNRAGGNRMGGNRAGGNLGGGAMPQMKPNGRNDRRTDSTFVFNNPSNYGNSGRRNNGNLGPDQLITPLTPRY
eukprot:jgi/Psemu1/252421/estExt_Genewise1Plus.C_470072